MSVKWVPDRKAPAEPLPPAPELAQFGIYRIVNHKRAVVDRYIDQELPGAIEKAVGEGAIETEAERVRIFEESLWTRYVVSSDHSVWTRTWHLTVLGPSSSLATSDRGRSR